MNVTLRASSESDINIRRAMYCKRMLSKGINLSKLKIDQYKNTITIGIPRDLVETVLSVPVPLGLELV